MDNQLLTPSYNDSATVPPVADNIIPSAAPPTPLPRSASRAWNIRALAYTVDVAMLYLIGYLMGMAVGPLLRIALSATGLAWEFGGQTNWAVSLGCGLIISMAYFVLFEWLFGATPGKLLLRQRVVQTDGSPCRLWPALVRGLLRLVDGLIWGLIAYMEMKRTPLQQRWGDRLSRTLVVSSRDPFIRRHRPWYALAPAAVVFLALELATSGGTLLSSGTIAPPNQLYVQIPAQDLNLTLAEVGREFTLKADGPLHLSGTDVREAHERLFTAPGIAVKSRVVVFKTYLTDKESDLANTAQKWTRQQVETAQEFRTLGSTKCSDRASFQTFSSSADDRQGYILALVKRNVVVLVVSFGQAELMQAEDIQALACAVGARIR